MMYKCNACNAAVESKQYPSDPCEECGASHYTWQRAERARIMTGEVYRSDGKLWVLTGTRFELYEDWKLRSIGH